MQSAGSVELRSCYLSARFPVFFAVISVPEVVILQGAMRANSILCTRGTTVPLVHCLSAPLRVYFVTVSLTSEHLNRV